MTKEQVANLHIGDEIWLAKFKLGYDTVTKKLTALIDYRPAKFVIRNYICDGNFNVVGFYVHKSNSSIFMHIQSIDFVDGELTENVKYVTSEKEIREWYENHKREEKERYTKQLEEATKELEEI